MCRRNLAQRASPNPIKIPSLPSSRFFLVLESITSSEKAHYSTFSYVLHITCQPHKCELSILWLFVANKLYALYTFFRLRRLSAANEAKEGRKLEAGAAGRPGNLSLSSC